MSTQLNVLILEDRPEEAELVVHELQRAGLEIAWQCVDGETDYLAALGEPPDLILSDYSMPGFNAMRALQLLRQRNLRIPFIVVSGAISEDIAVECMKQGADDYLLKDRLSRLAAAVRQALAKQQADKNNALLAGIVDSTDDAILSKTIDGLVMSWNAGAERIYGYRADEMIGQPAATLFGPERADEERRIREGLGRGEGINHYETVHTRKDGRRIDVSLTMSPLRDASGRLSGASMVARDITARKRAEKALQWQSTFVQLLQTVAVAANLATTLEQALQTAIDQICTCIGWPVGHAYVARDAEGSALLSSDIWYFADPSKFAIFQTITDSIRHAALDGLPGKVLLSGKPEWITDITEGRDVRARVISDIGVRASFAFPILIGAEVAAVLEFFAAEAIEPDEALLGIMAHIGTQLSRVVERSRAETALRDGEERYRLIAENTGDIITLIDTNGRQIYISPACEKLLGHQQSELLLTPFFDLVHPADRAIIQEQWAFSQAASGARVTVRLHHADGGWRWFEAHGTPLIQNGTEYILGVGRDVTERKQAEEALRTAEAKYRTLVEQLPAIIYTAKINEQSSTLYVSPQIQTILGFSPEEWMANPDLWVEQLHPDDRERVLAAVERAQASDVPVPEEYRSITRDGRVVWLQDAARVVRDEAGRSLFMQGITLDITERKEAEEALHTSERLYRTLASNFPNGAVILFDRDLRFTIADGKGLGDVGLSSAQVEGKTIWEVFPPEGVAVLEPLYRAALRGETTIIELPVGDQIYETFVLPVKNEHEAIFAGLIVSQNITERKRVEAALAEERALLTRRVEERTADLSAANAELARGARLKDEFLASMSHELRTPLNAILGLSEALQEEVYGELNDRQIRSLRSIEESGRHLLELINDILDLAKIGAGKMELSIEPVAVEPICQASLRLIKQAASKKRISVELTTDPAIEHVRADPRRLKQILVNLLSNAVKFTPEGGSIGVDVSSDQSKQLVEISVWDSGIGISKDHLSKLFQPFVQLDSRLARQFEGTGLGLALVYRMVEMHGGSIGVTSEVGVGSRFTVALPWRPARANTEAPVHPSTTSEGTQSKLATIRRALITDTNGPSASKRGQPPVLLLAEDNEANITTLSDYLTVQGYQVVVARNGAEAVARAREARPAVVLMDIQMPGMDGLEATRRIRADGDIPQMPIIALTALAMPGDREICLRAGATDYLTKPISLKGLAAKLQVSLINQGMGDCG